MGEMEDGIMMATYINLNKFKLLRESNGGKILMYPDDTMNVIS